MGEAVADRRSPAARHPRHAPAPGIAGSFGVPVCGVAFAYDGPRIDTPPPAVASTTRKFLRAGRG